MLAHVPTTTSGPLIVPSQIVVVSTLVVLREDSPIMSWRTRSLEEEDMRPFACFKTSCPWGMKWPVLKLVLCARAYASRSLMISLSMQQFRRREGTASALRYVMGKSAVRFTASKDPASLSLEASRMLRNALERVAFCFDMVRVICSLRSKSRIPPSFVHPAAKRRSRLCTRFASAEEDVSCSFAATSLANVETEAGCSRTTTDGLLRAMHPRSS